jgi:lipopolysaccharide heptosyltransferase II
MTTSAMANDSGKEKAPHDDVAGGLVILRLGALGDVANTLPAAAALRRALPDAHIVWIVEDASRDLVAASGIANDVILFPRRALAAHFRRPWTWHSGLAEFCSFIRMLRARRYDCILDFQGNLKSGLITLLSGCPAKIGFARGHCREGNWLFSNLQAVPARKRMPRAEKNAALAQVVQPELELAPVPMPVNAERAAVAAAFAAEFPARGPLVLLHPGASAFGEFKRWPPDRYGALAARLAERFNARCAVTWGPSERALAEEVVAASKGAARLAPVLDIPGLIELLRLADVVVAADTGPLHLAALLQRPVVAIYGPKDPEIYAPYGTRCEMVRADLPCSPCQKRSCDHGRCMKGIAVDQVDAAAAKLIGA